MKYQNDNEHGGFKIPFATGGGYTHVPNKLAAGMLKTRQRTKKIGDGPSNIDAIRLASYGTLDKLGGRFVTRGSLQTVGVCKCCGNDIRKLRLHPHFRARLNLLRDKYGRD
jgi:hypothetical protein